MSLDQLRKWIEDQLAEADEWFPDDESQKQGYILALQEVLDHMGGNE